MSLHQITTETPGLAKYVAARMMFEAIEQWQELLFYESIDHSRGESGDDWRDFAAYIDGRISFEIKDALRTYEEYALAGAK